MSPRHPCRPQPPPRPGPAFRGWDSEYALLEEAAVSPAARPSDICPDKDYDSDLPTGYGFHEFCSESAPLDADQHSQGDGTGQLHGLGYWLYYVITVRDHPSLLPQPGVPSHCTSLSRGTRTARMSLAICGHRWKAAARGRQHPSSTQRTGREPWRRPGP